MPGNDDKTEKASAHKRLEQRKKGNVFQSKDLISGVMILLSFLALRLLITYMIERFYSVLSDFLTMGATVKTFDIPVASRLMFDLVLNILVLALPILLIAMMLGLVMSVSQTRFIFTTDLLKPKFSRLNPIEGIKKMFNLKALVELMKSIAKVVVIVYIVYSIIMSKLREVPLLMMCDPISAVVWLGGAVFDVALYAGMGMLAIGIIDFFYQWWEHERSLMMSKQEQKDEYKQLEGDPNTKGRIKSIQRKMAQDRMMAGVKEADVVIRNPTHYAVAIKFNIGTDKDPVVIAKGIDYLALKIVEEAEKNNVKTVENPLVARTLYDNIDIYASIPEEFYEALSDIFYLIYNIKSKQDLKDKLKEG